MARLIRNDPAPQLGFFDMPLMQANECFSINMLSRNRAVNSKDLSMKFREKIKRFVAERRAITELSTLDDRVLQDIGVSRSHISAAVRNGR